MTDYKPGAVALCTLDGTPVLKTSDGPRGWATVDDGRQLIDDTDVRPLVVLDMAPEQARLVVRILRSSADADDQADSHPFRGLVTSTAYRAIADQIESQARPPKPAEPTGLGAVVEDAAGQRWTRYDERDPQPWWRTSTGDPDEPIECRFAYADIDAVKVLSKGVNA